MLTIAIIDKYPMVRKGMKFYFQDHFKEVNILEAESITALRTLHPLQSPDLTILGFNDNSDTISPDLIDTLKNWNSSGKIILYDGKPSENQPCTSRDLLYYRGGVNGYISKQSSVVQMMKYVDIVLNNKTMHFFE